MADMVSRVRFWPGQTSILLETVPSHCLGLNISWTILNRQFGLRHLLGFLLLMGFCVPAPWPLERAISSDITQKIASIHPAWEILLQGLNCSLSASRQSPKITLAIILLQIYVTKAPPNKRNLGWESGVLLFQNTELQTICFFSVLQSPLLSRRMPPVTAFNISSMLFHNR